MNKTITPNKENTSTTFYTKQSLFNSESYPFSAIKRHFDFNLETIEKYSLEADLLLEKLADKITVDESKIQKNYIQLNEISRQIEESSVRYANDKEVDSIVKVWKEEIRQIFSEKKELLQMQGKRYNQEIQNVVEGTQIKQKQLQNERVERDGLWSNLIDEFQKEITQLQCEFKLLRGKQDDYFEQNSVDIFNLEEQFQSKVEKQRAIRNQQHQMVIRLVSECIQNMKYVY